MLPNRPAPFFGMVYTKTNLSTRSHFVHVVPQTRPKTRLVHIASGNINTLSTARPYASCNSSSLVANLFSEASDAPTAVFLRVGLVPRIANLFGKRMNLAAVSCAGGWCVEKTLYLLGGSLAKNTAATSSRYTSLPPHRCKRSLPHRNGFWQRQNTKI